MDKTEPEAPVGHTTNGHTNGHVSNGYDSKSQLRLVNGNAVGTQLKTTALTDGRTSLGIIKGTALASLQTLPSDTFNYRDH